MIALGAHMSIAGGVDKALDRGMAIGCEAIQIFLKNNLQWSGRLYDPAEVARFHAARRIPVFAHSSYLINLAAADRALWQRSIAATVDELRRAARLGLPFVVLHPGAHGGAGEAAGLARVVAALDAVFDAAGDCRVRIALETTAGQGTSLGYRFEQLGAIIRACCQAARLAVCVDTAHVFAAGYDLRTPAGYRDMVGELDRQIGTRRVVAFHLNDSQTPLGSRVDRHAHIGRGQIGAAGFRRLLHDRRWDGLPMVLETPKGRNMRQDVVNLRLLRALRR